MTMNEWINKRCRIFIKNLSERPIIYTGKVLGIDLPFLTILDEKANTQIAVNVSDIIQIVSYVKLL